MALKRRRLTQEGEEEGDDHGEAEEDGTEVGSVRMTGPMGLGRATALAKLPSVSEWLRCWQSRLALLYLEPF